MERQEQAGVSVAEPVGSGKACLDSTAAGLLLLPPDQL